MHTRSDGAISSHKHTGKRASSIQSTVCHVLSQNGAGAGIRVRFARVGGSSGAGDERVAVASSAAAGIMAVAFVLPRLIFTIPPTAANAAIELHSATGINQARSSDDDELRHRKVPSSPLPLPNSVELPLPASPLPSPLEDSTQSGCESAGASSGDRGWVGTAGGEGNSGGGFEGDGATGGSKGGGSAAGGSSGGGNAGGGKSGDGNSGGGKDGGDDGKDAPRTTPLPLPRSPLASPLPSSPLEPWQGAAPSKARAAARRTERLSRMEGPVKRCQCSSAPSRRLGPPSK